MSFGREVLGTAVLELVTDGRKLTEGLGAAKKESEGWGGGVGSIAKTAGLAIVGIGAAATGIVGSLVAMGDGAANAAMEVRKLARETGLSAEEASKLRYAGERLNIDTDSLSKSLGIFSKTIETDTKKLDEYGVSVMRNADGTVNLQETIKAVATQFASMPDGVEKTNLAMQLFGKSGKDMIPLLDQGSKGLFAMGEEAEKMGLVFSKDATDGAFKFGQAQKDLSEQFEGLRNKVGLAVMPALTGLFAALAKFASDVLPRVAAAIAPAVEAFGRIWAIATEIFDVFTGRAPDAGAALTAAIGPESAKAIMGAVAGVRDTVMALADALGNAITWFNSTDDAAVIVRGGLRLLWDVLSTVVGFILTDVIGALGKMKGTLGELGPAVAKVRDIFDGFRLFFLELWKGLVLAVSGLVNGIIGVINGFIEKYDALAGKLGLPLIGKIELVTPNLDDVNARIDQIAHDRSARIFANVYEQAIAGGGGPRAYAGGTDHITAGPELFIAGESGVEHVRVTPLGRDSGASSGAGAGHGHDIIMDGQRVARAVGRRFMDGAGAAGAPLG